MSVGYHKCEHCGDFHSCGRSQAGCSGAIAVLLLLVLLGPVLILPVEAWLTIACEKWPNWSKGCENKQMLIINDDLNRRVKALEEARK